MYRSLPYYCPFDKPPGGVGKYTQCALQRIGSESKAMTWLPSDFAILNKIVSIKNKETWVNYKIIGVYSSRDAEDVLWHEKIYSSYRKQK